MFGVTAQIEESRLVVEVEHLFRVACRLTGSVHDAEDLVQDVCERALRKAPAFVAAEDCRRWLLRVLYNRFVDGQRRRERSPVVTNSVSGTDDRSPPERTDPAELAAASDAESALERAWSRLEPAQQAILLLRAEGHELDEIAAITAIDKPALSSRLHRARASLAKFLEQERSALERRAISEET